MKYLFRSFSIIALLALSLTLARAAANNEKDTDYDQLKKVKTIEEVVVTATRVRHEWERRYKDVAGKRIFKGPYGDGKMIIAISQELKNRGEKTRVFTRGITMPQTFSGSTLDNYKYLLKDKCGLNRFSFYEGPDFTALAYIEGPREILLDVMTGGGPFSAPGIWGPYDQIIGKHHKMKMIMGNASKDGLGPIKGGYAIGMEEVIPSYEMQDHGYKYSDVVKATGTCLADKLNAEAAAKVLSRN